LITLDHHKDDFLVFVWYFEEIRQVSNFLNVSWSHLLIGLLVSLFTLLLFLFDLHILPRLVLYHCILILLKVHLHFRLFDLLNCLRVTQ
jgi:hypothetical protein